MIKKARIDQGTTPHGIASACWQGACAGTSAATHSSDDFQVLFDCMTSLARAREGQFVLLHHTPCALSSSIAAL